MSAAIQKIPILKPLTPTGESSRSGTLRYDGLESAVKKHAPSDTMRWREFLDTDADSIEELTAARQLANLYILMGLQALHNAPTPESAQLWSWRYTEAASAVYGIPSKEVARNLEINGFEANKQLKELGEQVRDYFYTEYADVFACADRKVLPQILTPDDVKGVFSDVLDTLSRNHDSDWSEWSVVVDDTKDSLSVVSRDKQIIIGGERRDMPADELHGLIAHEMLVHAQCSLNGYKTSELLGTGLPGYLDAEEGLGVFVEFALTGKIPRKIIDRYTDIAYALGQLDGTTHTRQETLARVMSREQMRAPEKSWQEVEDFAYPHVNRIYRGSLGNDHIGVFTKDIAYYNGFMKTIEFFIRAHEQAIPIGETMRFRMSGCFDPNDSTHRGYLENHAKTSQDVQ